MERPNKPCYVCGSNTWWQRPDGGWRCNRCHPNPDPGSNPVPASNKAKYSPDVLALRDRVIVGNKKLNDAWEQLIKIADDKERWAEEMERWHQANEKLSILCDQLKLTGYEDCLYLSKVEVPNSKRTKSCLGQGGIGCRVCPSRIPYWEQELMELPSPK